MYGLRMTEPTILDAGSWMTPAAAAATLGVSTKTVSRWADDGRIRVLRPGLHRRYHAADIAALISAEPWSPAA